MVHKIVLCAVCSFYKHNLETKQTKILWSYAQFHLVYRIAILLYALMELWNPDGPCIIEGKAFVENVWHWVGFEVSKVFAFRVNFHCLELLVWDINSQGHP